MQDKDVLDMTLDELIKATLTAAKDSRHEQMKMQATRILAERLIEQLDRNATSADSLSRKVFWLNVILTIVTVVGVVIAYLGLFQK